MTLDDIKLAGGITVYYIEETHSVKAISASGKEMYMPLADTDMMGVSHALEVAYRLVVELNLLLQTCTDYDLMMTYQLTDVCLSTHDGWVFGIDTVLL